MNRYLLIDDDDIIQFIHGKVISKADPDAQVTTVFSVDEGLETLKRRAPEDLPDFIFVDISMPIKSGFALIDELLAHCPVLYAALREHSRLFFLTSSVNPKDVIRSEQCELAERMLAKPLSPAVLQKLKSSSLVSPGES